MFDDKPTTIVRPTAHHRTHARVRARPANPDGSIGDFSSRSWGGVAIRDASRIEQDIRPSAGPCPPVPIEAVEHHEMAFSVSAVRSFARLPDPRAFS